MSFFFCSLIYFEDRRERVWFSKCISGEWRKKTQFQPTRGNRSEKWRRGKTLLGKEKLLILNILILFGRNSFVIKIKICRLKGENLTVRFWNWIQYFKHHKMAYLLEKFDHFVSFNEIPAIVIWRKCPYFAWL